MITLRVSKHALLDNLHQIEKALGDTKLLGVVKGNGYGLSTLPFAKTLLEGGVSSLAVARLQDAALLREGGIDSELLLLTPVATPEEAALAADLRLTCAVDSASCALLLNTAAKERNLRIPIHIKIDTGFGRYGFPPDCAEDVKQILRGCEFLAMTGTFSHLSNAFGKSPAVTQKQLALFLEALQKLEQAGVPPGLRHLANSFAALRFPETRLDAVRIGSAFTGRLPLKAPRLTNAAVLTCPISELRWLPKGANIGYANVFRTKRPTKIALLQIGYGDGFGCEKARDTFRFLDVLRYLLADFKKLFSGRYATCQIGGKRCRLLGRVGLCNVAADVTNLDCSVGDEAVFSANPIFLQESVPRVYF